MAPGEEALAGGAPTRLPQFEPWGRTIQWTPKRRKPSGQNLLGQGWWAKLGVVLATGARHGVKAELAANPKDRAVLLLAIGVADLRCRPQPLCYAAARHGLGRTRRTWAASTARAKLGHHCCAQPQRGSGEDLVPAVAGDTGNMPQRGSRSGLDGSEGRELQSIRVHRLSSVHCSSPGRASLGQQPG